MADQNTIAILLLSCPDCIGLVERIAHFIFERAGNILDLEEHVDPEDKIFFVRVAWDMSHFTISPSELKDAFAPLAKEFKAAWTIQYSHVKSRIAIFVSKHDHCLQEILWRHKMNEYEADIPLIISNHENLKSLPDQNEIPFYIYSIRSHLEHRVLVHGRKTIVFD